MPAKKKVALPLDQVHPNEEQLMRISDILADALAIADDEVCAIDLGPEDLLSALCCRIRPSCSRTTSSSSRAKSLSRP